MRELHANPRRPASQPRKRHAKGMTMGTTMREANLAGLLELPDRPASVEH
jgi:hypothetical protein